MNRLRPLISVLLSPSSVLSPPSSVLRPTAQLSQSRGTARVVITAVNEGFNRDPGALFLAGGPTASVVSETADGPAVRACPLNSVTGHSPEIFFHAVRTDHETARTGPAKTLLLRAGAAYVLFRPPPSSLLPGFFQTVHFSLLSVFELYSNFKSHNCADGHENRADAMQCPESHFDWLCPAAFVPFVVFVVIKLCSGLSSLV